MKMTCGFMQFDGIHQPEDFHSVTRSHVLAWRTSLEAKQLGGSTIRRNLAALSSLFEHLCEGNAVAHNPVKGVKRPVVVALPQNQYRSKIENSGSISLTL